MVDGIDFTLECRKSLLKYAGILVSACVALQIVIAVRGSQIDLVAGLLTGLIALYYAYYQYASLGTLRYFRFGRLISHLVAFIAVNLSFHFHALVLFITDSTAIDGGSNFPIDEQWFGVLFGMATFWGIGALIHTIASIASRGFEDVPS